MEEKGRSDRGDVTMAASVEHRSLEGAYYVFPHRVNLFSIASLCTFYFPSEQSSLPRPKMSLCDYLTNVSVLY